MTNEKIHQLNLRELQLGLKLIELANEVIAGDVGSFGSIPKVINEVKQSMANEQKNGLKQLEEMGEGDEDESLYAGQVSFLDKVEQAINNINGAGTSTSIGNTASTSVSNNKAQKPGKESSSPEQIQDLEKEMGTEGKGNEPTENSNWGGEQMADLKNIMSGFKEGPDNRFGE